MKNKLKVMLSISAAALLILTGQSAASKTSGQITAHAALTGLEPVLVYGPVSKNTSGSLSLNNQSGISYSGEIELNLSEHTRILSAVTGFPVNYADITDGETAYVYLSPAMSLSLPPMNNPSMILCQIPADYKVPAYIMVESASWNQNHTELTVTAVTGESYSIPSDCEITPYLTRNIVRLDDIEERSTCLIWTGNNDKAYKVLLFADSEDSISDSLSESDSAPSGWLQKEGKWYYYHPETGTMATGFLTIDGKTYYFLKSGEMLTKPMTFSPDSNGVLH